ncbi:dihydrodipicolinate synthase family protein [Roseobacter ponti]|uniref:Dihydrodipicolinate synthase family protein n=1 Tax=Roseobacter ponti TaxID=1891787 RepID=A0A858SXG1_9RHOB|nr:dihydrodipicolinate synthase family protein [Roseobacter ponti]QJF52323.1 dihydrodipicolinate synthase family protein [Roseobacter ponti]
MEITIGHFGISTALLTPFHPDGHINLRLLCSHANHMLQSGTQGVTLFGTTGEGASIGLTERQSAISAMIESGVAPGAMTLGLCASAISDVVAQVWQGCEFGITRFLLLPPFYFKNVHDEGVFEWHAQLFEAADTSAQFILYHIPQITQVPLSVDLTLRLCDAFPKRVLAIKDSAGQWGNTRALLESGKVPVLVGDERLLHKAAAMGGAGSICGMANIYPARMRTLFESQAEDVDLSSEVDLIVSQPVIPALKQAMAARTGNPDWVHLRAPLQPLTADARAVIEARFSIRADVT